MPGSDAFVIWRVGCGHGAAAKPCMRDVQQWTRAGAHHAVADGRSHPQTLVTTVVTPEERTTAAACAAAAGHVSGQYVAGPRVTVTEDVPALAGVPVTVHSQTGSPNCSPGGRLPLITFMV